MESLLAALAPLHHPGGDAATGFDWFDAVILVVILLVLGAVGYALYRLVQRRREGP